MKIKTFITLCATLIAALSAAPAFADNTPPRKTGAPVPFRSKYGRPVPFKRIWIPRTNTHSL